MRRFGFFDNNQSHICQLLKKKRCYIINTMHYAKTTYERGDFAISKRFMPMTTELAQKKYPKGYIALLAKEGSKGGKIIIGCGVVLAAIGLLIGCGAIMVNDRDGLIILGIFSLVFLIPGILCILFGVKRSKVSESGWLQKMVDASDYPEEVIRDFASQVVQSDCVKFDIEGASMHMGYLTRDYILFENLMKLCVIKRSDIIGAYLANMASISINTMAAKRPASVTSSLNVVLISNHKTFIIMSCKLKEGQQLISMLTEKSPEIDTANGRILSEDELQKIAKDHNVA